jgi:hypothetical protein
MSRSRKFVLFGVLPAAAILSVLWLTLTPANVGSVSIGADFPFAMLPADARDVRWRYPGPFDPYTLYEFSTSKNGFQEWVDRYRDSEWEGPLIGPHRMVVYDPDPQSSGFREIEHAILYRWLKEDRGKEMVYDTDAHRAYYFTHSR